MVPVAAPHFAGAPGLRDGVVFLYGHPVRSTGHANRQQGVPIDGAVVDVWFVALHNRT
jgi:hypothetical protein